MTTWTWRRGRRGRGRQGGGNDYPDVGGKYSRQKIGGFGLDTRQCSHFPKEDMFEDIY